MRSEILSKIVPGSIIISANGTSRKVLDIVDGLLAVETNQGVKMVDPSKVAQVLPPPPLDPDVIDYAELCLSCPEITEAEGIDAVLNFRQALTPSEMAELIQALPPKLAKRLYQLQEVFDRHLIPVGSTAYGQQGTGALVVARDGGNVTIQLLDGKQAVIPSAKVLRWVYPVSDREVHANEQN